MNKADEIISEHAYEEAARTNWVSYWQELAKYVNPMRNDVYGYRVKGDKRGEELLDSTAIHSNELYASAMHSSLTNPAVFWFGGTFGDDTVDYRDDVRLAMSKNVSILHGIFNSSNFQTEIHENYLDEGSLGTSVMLVEEDEKDVVRFQALPIYEFCIKENHRGVVDTSYRKFKWFGKQITDKWGETLDKETLNKLTNKQAEEFWIIHCVKPRKSGKSYAVAKLPSEYMFESIYVLCDNRVILEESGYHEMPLIFTRASKLAGETYGRSNAMKCLPAIKMVNRMVELNIKAAQLTVAPPFLLPDDGVHLPLKIQPLGVTLYRPGMREDIKPLLSNLRVDVGLDFIKETRQEIKQAFYADQLQLRESDRMTATEVMRHTDDFLRILGPLLGRQHNEKLKPLITRVFNIAARKGKLVPFPKDVQAMPLEFTYRSQIAKAQRASELNNVQKAFALIAPLSAAQPDMMDNIDGDKFLRYAFTANGAPEELIRTAANVESIRTGRQKAQEEQADMIRKQQESEQLKAQAPMITQAMR